MFEIALTILLLQASEKDDVALDDVPAAVIDTASAARPDLSFEEAEREVRNGVVYYDVEGRDPQGAAWELDIMQDGAGWTVVELQRDIEPAQTPDAVLGVLAEHASGFAPTRIIESTQSDGRIVYEFFDAAGEKREVLWDGETAEFLTEEWAH